MLFRDQILEITLHADGQHDLLHAEWPVTRWTHDTVIIVSLIWSLLRLFQDHHQQDQWWSQRILFLSCWTWSDDATLSDDIDWGGWSQLSDLMFDWDTMIGVDEVKQVWNYYQPSSGREELCWELSLSSNNNMMEEYCFVFKYFPTLHLLTQDHMVCTLVHQTFTTTSLHLERPWLGRAFE